MADDRDKVLKLLADLAYDYAPRQFLLSSGKVSDEYLDCRRALSQPGAFPCIGNLFLSYIDHRVTALGGLTMGADPIAIGTSFASSLTGRNVRWFAVRKEPKKHGRKKLIEGDFGDGNVAVVDDVVTTGASTIQAIQSCRDEGLHIVQVIVLVDREEDEGMRKIADAAGPLVHLDAIFKKSDVHRQWMAARQGLPATA